MQPYNKRAKGGWRQGKSYKGENPERQYSKIEIRQQLAEAEDDYLEKHHRGAGNKNKRARLEYRVKWYEDLVAKYSSNQGIMGGWFRDGLAKAKKDLENLIKKEKETLERMNNVAKTKP